MGLLNNTVHLENNYSLWKKMFEEEKKRLTDLFNNESFVIEHVGSTSVNGLYSKPIVDIAIGVGSLDDLNNYMNTLKKIYSVKENYEKQEILLIKEEKEETHFLIHILPINSDRFNNMIKFRNILREYPEVLKKYEKLKKELSIKYANDRKIYTSLKNDFIQNVLNNYCAK